MIRESYDRNVSINFTKKLTYSTENNVTTEEDSQSNGNIKLYAEVVQDTVLISNDSTNFHKIYRQLLRLQNTSKIETSRPKYVPFQLILPMFYLQNMRRYFLVLRNYRGYHHLKFLIVVIIIVYLSISVWNLFSIWVKRF